MKTLIPSLCLACAISLLGPVMPVQAGCDDTYLPDSDGDGYGDSNQPTNSQECTPPPGYVYESEGGDCDDSNPNVHPGAAEVCDGLDNDCNNQIDDNPTDAPTFYPDADGDGYGEPHNSRTDMCEGNSDYVLDNTDCNDNDSSINPGAQEVCDGVDNNCNGFMPGTTRVAPGGDGIDEGVTTTYYYDGDGDGYGDENNTIEDCSPPPGYVEGTSEFDCNDADANAFPGNSEICDGVDNDCNGQIDDNPTDAPTLYYDGDGDGYGDPNNSRNDSCALGNGYGFDNTDCDDNEATTNPGAEEVCDGVDNNCSGANGNVTRIAVNGHIDEGVKNTYYRDADGDGFGNMGDTTEACSPPPGYVEDSTDCDDTNSDVNPAAQETCDGLDNDCDNEVDEGVKSTFYHDGDSDGYGDPNDPQEGCSETAGYVTDSSDCDDNDPAINPAATETCDGADNDCNTVVDDDYSTDAQTGYQDSDGDGYGDPSVSFHSCQVNWPSGYVPDGTDCNDAEADAYPGNTEVCDGLDNDCDMMVDEGFPDLDNDTMADCVDSDDDNDGVPDTEDNCPTVSNADQADSDNNMVGDFCDGQRNFANLSTRAEVGTGEDVEIGGFITQPDALLFRANQARALIIPDKKILIRGIGPSMGMPGYLADPFLELFDSNGVSVASNDNWGDSPDAAEIQALGLAPGNASESAILATVPGDSSYTAVLSGVADGTGLGLVEIYDLSFNNGAHLANISTRAFVQTNDEVLIGGVIVRGAEGGQMVVRGIGPSLDAHGIANPLEDPVLELHDENGNLLAMNDDWGDSPNALAIAAIGLAPTDEKEAALLFEPGTANYTAVLKGKNDGTGVAVVEAYWVNQILE